MSDEIRYLLDRAAIIDVMSNYATGLDARDWVLWRSVFVDEVVFDLSVWSGQKPRLLQVDRVVSEQARIFDELSVTQHFFTNHRVTVSGDTARCRMHMRAEHWLKPIPLSEGVGTSEDALHDRYTMFGYYDDKLIRTNEGWKIQEMQLKVTRSEGPRSVMDQAARRARARKLSERE
jgi:hypothetical protein